jgi:hypothetical protein
LTGRSGNSEEETTTRSEPATSEATRRPTNLRRRLWVGASASGKGAFSMVGLLAAAS